MRRKLISVVLSAMILMPISAQTVNTDSIKAQMDKIEITNQGMKQVIENYKKGVIKGDLESKTLLGLECISGKYVKPDAAMGLVLLEEAANQNYVDAQYNLGNLYYGLWVKKPNNDTYFSQGVKWLRKSVRAADNRSVLLLSRFYYDYGIYKNEISYIDGSIKLLETYPEVAEVSTKEEQVLNAQALLGTAHLSKWRMERDTTALRDAKKWYRTLLKSNLHFPNFTQYIDSMQIVLSMGVPMRIDPQPTAQEIEESQNTGGMGGFPGGGFGGFGGGRPGGGMPGGQPQGPQRPQAKFLGGGQAMQQFIRSNTLYPENLKSQKINGRSTISFTVDTDGSIIYPLVSNHAVVNDVEIFIMDQEALRTIMIMPDWIPADEDGKPVQAQHSATVNFGSGGGRGGFGF
ncbi:MAG: energy transducer TonB [Bacteroidaceae bacterium]|nr:energy transducer TonB [Bacteroidaceae bacterium]